VTGIEISLFAIVRIVDDTIKDVEWETAESEIVRRWRNTTEAEIPLQIFANSIKLLIMSK
jgi:hypothetical protein